MSLLTTDLQIESSPVYTDDTLFAGKLSCAQSQDGYRFSIDAILLAHFITPRRCDRILDLGAGCGVISLILAFRHPEISITCLELQNSLVELINHNVDANKLRERIQILPGDLCRVEKLVAVGEYDFVVCNPPYYRADTGRHNVSMEQAVARHELKARLEDVVRAASYALRTKGRLAMIYPASRFASLIVALKQNLLEPKRMRTIHSYPGADATLCLVEAVKCGGDELIIQQPLYIYDHPGGGYSPEVAGWYHSE